MLPVAGGVAGTEGRDTPLLLTAEGEDGAGAAAAWEAAAGGAASDTRPASFLGVVADPEAEEAGLGRAGVAKGAAAAAEGGVGGSWNWMLFEPALVGMANRSTSGAFAGSGLADCNSAGSMSGSEAGVSTGPVSVFSLDISASRSTHAKPSGAVSQG
jgi:hypothetical protein